MMARALSFGQSRRRRHGGLVSEYELTYTVADDFTLAGRTFRRGEELPGNDREVSVLLRVETVLGRQLLFVRTGASNGLHSAAEQPKPSPGGDRPRRDADA
jgi:hypothetical protein